MAPVGSCKARLHGMRPFSARHGEWWAYLQGDGGDRHAVLGGTVLLVQLPIALVQVVGHIQHLHHTQEYHTQPQSESLNFWPFWTVEERCGPEAVPLNVMMWEICYRGCRCLTWSLSTSKRQRQGHRALVLKARASSGMMRRMRSHGSVDLHSGR